MAPSELRPVGLKCEYRVDPLGIDEGAPEAELGARVGGEGTGTVGLPHPGRKQRGGTRSGGEPPVGQRQGRVGPLRGHRVRGRGVAIGLAVRVEGACLGRGRRSIALQRTGRLRDGASRKVGLEGSLDLPRQKPRRGLRAPDRRRVRRPGQRPRPEPVPAQGVSAGQAGPQGAPLRDGPRRLRTAPERLQGRR